MEKMIGAICGDILGSTYEFGSKDKEIYLMHDEDHFTDDSVLTFALAEWALEYGNVPLGNGEHKYLLAKKFYEFTEKYPDKAYGLMYVDWICKYEDTGKIPMPNNSYGNGAAMRVSPVAYVFDEIETVEKYARLQAEITHYNSEGIRGACAIAAATKMALDGWDKNEIKDYISNKYYYDLSMTLEEIKVKGDHFRAICQETVPQALIAFFAGKDYCDVILKAISIGGDCDTVAAMAGGIAFAYYKEIPDEIVKHCLRCLDKELLGIYYKFKELYIDNKF